MVAAAGAGMAAVDHEFLGTEPRQPRLLVDALRDRRSLAPFRRRVDIDLDHAGIGRDLDHVEARVEGGRIALDMHGLAKLFRHRFDRGDEVEIILQPLDRGQEDAEHVVADFEAERRAVVIAADLLLAPVLDRP